MEVHRNYFTFMSMHSHSSSLQITLRTQVFYTANVTFWNFVTSLFIVSISINKHKQKEANLSIQYFCISKTVLAISVSLKIFVVNIQFANNYNYKNWKKNSLPNARENEDCILNVFCSLEWNTLVRKKYYCTKIFAE